MLAKKKLRAGIKVRLKKTSILSHSGYGLRCHAPHGVQEKIYPSCVGTITIKPYQQFDGELMYICYEDGRTKFLADRKHGGEWVFNEDTRKMFKIIDD